MKRRFCALILSAIGLLAGPQTVFAAELDDTAIGSISQNCASIKLRLKNIQKTDSKNRVQLGSYYEMINTNLMLNLNLRLVKNSLANAELSEQQTSFASERERFKTEYTNYQRELDELIDIDCRAEPKDFYSQLEKTRARRAKVAQIISNMTAILNEHRDSVVKLRGEL